MSKIHFLHETENMQLTCSYCCNRLVNPLQTKNGCRFCLECFLTTRNIDRSCQRCAEENIPAKEDCFKLGVEDCYSDKAVVYDMYKMEAVCEQCGCIGTYRDIQKYHEKHGCKEAGYTCCQAPSCPCMKPCWPCQTHVIRELPE